MKIGNVTIESKLALAPMAGVTDAAFRQICAELGAAMTCTELISSKALCYRDKKTFTLLRQFPGEHPGAVQIFGSLLLQTYWLSLLYGKGFIALVGPRAVISIVLIPVYALLIQLISAALHKAGLAPNLKH